mgnify:CR=1 FL=1
MAYFKEKLFYCHFLNLLLIFSMIFNLISLSIIYLYPNTAANNQEKHTDNIKRFQPSSRQKCNITTGMATEPKKIKQGNIVLCINSDKRSCGIYVVI